MYQFSYADIMADAAGDARATERRALDEAASRLRAAAGGSAGSAAERAALDFTTELWSLLIGDLAQPGNAAPDRLKADLMSIGLGVMAECGRIAAGTSRDLDGVADICAIIRDGLK